MHLPYISISNLDTATNNIWCVLANHEINSQNPDETVMQNKQTDLENV